MSALKAKDGIRNSYLGKEETPSDAWNGTECSICLCRSSVLWPIVIVCVGIGLNGIMVHMVPFRNTGVHKNISIVYVVKDRDDDFLQMRVL